MKLWKILGLAGLAGVAATGAIIARDQRQRADLKPDEIRDRLHQRLAEVAAADHEHASASSPPTAGQW
jgi:hypothetical protein